ncbi:hypothetical protein RQP46_008003 [Phenoliferia psychrophenolica]
MAELTQHLRRALIGPVVLGESAQIILWGVLAGTVGRFVSSAQWGKLSMRVKVMIGTVLLLVTGSTGTAIYTLWNAGTAPPKNLLGTLEVTVGQAVNIFLVGLVAALVQSIMIMRACLVVPAGRWRVGYAAAMGVLITLELLAWVVVVIFTIHYQRIDFTSGATPFIVASLNGAQAVIVWLALDTAVIVAISASCKSATT